MLAANRKLLTAQGPATVFATRSLVRLHSTYPHSQQHLSHPLSIRTRVLDDAETKKHDDKLFITHPLFPHPKFSAEDCEKVKIEHRDPVTFGDKVAYRGTMLTRSLFDFVTGYRKPKTEAEELNGFKGTRYEMNEGKWLTRCIFLESIAGVPGMVAAFIRHLHSVRLLKRDKAWIETLLDEAYNERMHLLTFIKLGQPSWFTRTIIYIGQGVFCNLFFLMYLIKPRYCHRFVGYLEEEAVSTYTHLLYDIDHGRLPCLNSVELPTIAVQYWPDLDKKSNFRDLIERIRADESKHREVNHTLANLRQRADRNPFALRVSNSQRPQPNNGLTLTKGKGWERDDLIL